MTKLKTWWQTYSAHVAVWLSAATFSALIWFTAFSMRMYYRVEAIDIKCIRFEKELDENLRQHNVFERRDQHLFWIENKDISIYPLYPTRGAGGNN
jgi:hypothetical protein